MSDVKKLDEKLNNLESKLKATFEELEKRLNELAATHTDDSENRFQEIEDLVLLIQVEQMKIMERMHASLDVNLSDGSSTVNTNTKLAELEKIVLQMAERIDMLEGNKPNISVIPNDNKIVKMHEGKNATEKKAEAPVSHEEKIKPKTDTLDKLHKILAG